MSKEEGFALVQRWKESGLTQGEYSKANGNSLHTLRHYSRMLNPKSQNPHGIPSDKLFVEATLKQIPKNPKVMIKFSSGIEVHLESAGDLSSLLKAIRHL